MNNYYKELPENYVEASAIDAKNKKTVVLFNVFAVILTFLGMGILLVIKYLMNKNIFDRIKEDKFALLYLVGWFVAYIAYMVVHEITHGIFYKLFTKQKLTFGTNGMVAWCGLKEGYFNKKTGLFAILAPLVIHSLWMIPVSLLTNGMLSLTFILLFGCHFGGCIGDIYGTIMMIKMPKDVLISDNGYRQVFYLPKE